ncbi:DNA cytosine methyltransferase [Citrobacter werkmanii]|uniref:DNA cytosine methyltransferase n=1 Tax=Citrobacter werkmanii TaxID=67827 RepID=UPI000506D5B2|nr:DNA cytosine methyltransferase [Citrobacter werkmanii]UCA26029.1 DNA cytosine methyltransferase [Citrobacter werkmanii]GAL43022.1 putative methyltransferase [Citrobacter werkmanii NBRC 105721]
MITAAYYNEIDQFAAQWLRNLIAGGHIAPGEVDERSIEDVTPDDLRGFTQCHFFAGIGVWSHALRLAGWPDNKPIWTGSCPCQPFSATGKGSGFDDDRHLWPAFGWLIKQCRPERVFGEQVAGGRADPWFDLVQNDVERMGYAFGITPFPAAGIGAPHIRERAYWVAHASSGRYDRRTEAAGQEARTGAGIAISNCVDGVGNANVTRLEGLCGNDCAAGWEGTTGPATKAGIHDGLAHTDNEQHPIAIRGCGHEYVSTGRQQDPAAFAGLRGDYRPLEVNGFWRDADWLFCRDGKWRPVEPGTFPLVDGAAARLGRVEPGVARVASSNRVGRLKGYGNAINAQAAAEFIRAYMGVSYGR